MATDLVREAGERFGLTGAVIGVARGDSEEVLGLGVTSAENALVVDGDTRRLGWSDNSRVTSTAGIPVPTPDTLIRSPDL